MNPSSQPRWMVSLLCFSCRWTILVLQLRCLYSCMESTWRWSKTRPAVSTNQTRVYHGESCLDTQTSTMRTIRVGWMSIVTVDRPTLLQKPCSIPRWTDYDYTNQHLYPLRTNVCWDRTCFNIHFLIITAVSWLWFFHLFPGCTILPCGLNSLTCCWMPQTSGSPSTTFSSLSTWNWKCQETLCFAAKSSTARKFSRLTSLNASTNRKTCLFLSESGHIYQHYYDHVTIDFR